MISTEVLKPIEKDSNYTLSIFLIYVTKSSTIKDDVDPYTSYPLRFQVLGGVDSCNYQEILVDSLITETEWRQYIFDITPKFLAEFLSIRVYWDTNISKTPYNGIMLLDSMSFTKDCMREDELTDTVYYKTSPYQQLVAPNGVTWRWEPERYLSQSTGQSTSLIDYDKDMPEINVIVTDQDNCTFEKKYKILFSCDTLYPDRDTATYTKYFKTYKDVYLNASSGESYNWDNGSKLSATDIRNPMIIEYDSVFYVTIADEDSCTSVERYRVLLDCDSLYPSTEYTHSIRKVNYGETVELAPDFLFDDFGTINSITWSPQDNLSCVECITTELTADEDKNYIVEYTDYLNCIFTEIFPIQIEFEIPNVITPGINGEGDGKNDVFRIPGLPENSSIEIYDKSGRLIFKADPYSATNWWDGTDTKGKPVRSGTYWYVLRMGDTGKPVKGFVLVKR